MCVSQHFHLNPAGQTTLTKEDQASGLGFSYQGIKTGAKAFVLMPGAEISMEQGLVSFHYNQLTECPWICIRKRWLFQHSDYSHFNDNTADASLVPVTVPVTGEVLKDQDAQALRIRNGRPFLSGPYSIIGRQAPIWNISEQTDITAWAG